MTESAAAWPPTSTAISYEEYLRLLAQRNIRSQGGRSLNHRIAVERILVLAFGRAVLMQYAHPLIATAVADHSYSMQSAKGKADRFDRTMALRMQLTFGDPQAVWNAAQHIDRLHASIFGTLSSANDKEGTHYSARDPDLIRWVHATVVDSTLLVYQKFVRPLTPSQRDVYLREASITGPLLGAGDTLVKTEPELRAYMDRCVASGVFRGTPAAVWLTRQTLEGLPVPIIGGVANAMGRTLIKELLPSWCRDVLHLESSALGRILLAGSAHAFKGVRPLLPKSLAQWPARTASETDSPVNPDGHNGCPFHSRQQTREVDAS